MEYIQQFSIAENGVVHLKPSAPCKGKLELNIVEGGPVYLFRGRVEASAAASATALNSNVQFDLGASPTGSAQMSIEGEIGTITVFSRKASIGFLRFIES